MITKTPADITKLLKGFYDQNVTALQGVIDKLPEALKADFTKIKDDLNSQLEKLRPLDQVPAAGEASNALEYLAGSIVRMQEYATELMRRLDGITQSLATKTSAYQGLDDQIKAGEYLTKAAADSLVTAAREDAAKSFQPQITAMRKTQVELAGLPEAGADVLELPQDKFETAFAEAKANLAKLTAKGLKLGGRGAALVTELCWKPATECDGKLTAWADILGAPPAPAAGKKAGDPLLGGGSKEANSNTPPARATVLACV